MKVGIAGTGKMGQAVAQRLMGLGHELMVWNRNAARADARPLHLPVLELQVHRQAHRRDVVFLPLGHLVSTQPFAGGGAGFRFDGKLPLYGRLIMPVFARTVQQRAGNVSHGLHTARRSRSDSVRTCSAKFTGAMSGKMSAFIGAITTQ